MMANKSWKSSFAVKESKYFRDKHNKIKLVGECPLNGSECSELLDTVNDRLLTSEIYFRNKEYPQSIEAIKAAFYKISELRNESCKKCIDLFQSTIIQSLENINNDLEKTCSGFLGKRRYRSSYILAADALAEMKKACKI